MNQKKTIVVLHGSLRDTSSSAAIIRKVAELIGYRTNLILFRGTGELPHFDDKAEIPDSVTTFRKLIFDADGVVICTPEYAFGIPGTLKNALDWTVSSGEFDKKPVALITASSIGEKGHAAMINVLTAINGRMSEETNLLISFIRSKIGADGEVSDEKTISALYKLVEAFINMMNEPSVS